MTDDEKGALLLAAHSPGSNRETVELHYGDWGYASRICPKNDTHRITFDLIDDEPDVDSVRMEKI